METNDVQGTETVETTEQSQETTSQETQSQKQEESTHDKASRLKRQLKQTLKKAGDELSDFDLSDLTSDPKPKKENTKQEKSDGLDETELMYLEFKGVTDENDVEYVQEVMNDTGKSLREVLKSKHVQAELAERQEAAKVEAATPKKGKRSQGDAKSTVDFWIAKGELPPADQPQLRRDVVNAKVKKETSASKFTDTPVVS